VRSLTRSLRCSTKTSVLTWGRVLGLALVLASSAQLYGEDDETKKDMSQTESRDMLEDREDSPRNGILRQRTVFARDSESVLNAFLPAISEAPDSVVEIWVGEERVALGTIVSEDGEVLTKGSQITGAPTIRLASGEKVKAAVKGIDLKDDLALLKIDDVKTEPIRWDQASTPDVGAWVISALPGKDVGTIGIVSVGSREIPKERGALGVRLDNESEGVVVSDFSGSDTPAKRAGVRVGDRITEVNSEPLEEISDLIKAVQACSPGDVVVLSIERGEASLTLEVVLDTLAVIDDAWKHKEMQENLGAELSLVRSGFTEAMQHDSELGPQDCGGPLLDLAGNPIGVNIARAGRVCSYTLPIEIVKTRLEVLRSGELAPEIVFSARIERLDNAVKSLAAQFESEFDPKLAELNEAIQKLAVQEEEVESDVESANSKLEDLKRQIEELSSKRDELDEKIKSLQGKRERYQVTVEALRKGIRVN